MIDLDRALKALRIRQLRDLNVLRTEFLRRTMIVLDSLKDEQGKIGPQAVGTFKLAMLPIYEEFYGRYPGDSQALFYRTTVVHAQESYELAGSAQRALVAEMVGPDAPFDKRGREKDYPPDEELVSTFALLYARNLLSLNDVARWVDPNGYTLGHRMWGARLADEGALVSRLIRGIAVGAATREVRRFLSPRSPGGNYGARRIAVTEANRAFGRGVVHTSMVNPLVEGVRWRLSFAHKELDPCDTKARGSSRGFPPGVYLPGEVPPHPTHPNCACYLTPYSSLTGDQVQLKLRTLQGTQLSELTLV